MNLKVATYNCKNVKSSIHEIQELCKINDIIFLQETWLFEQDLPLLSGISLEHYALGTSSINCSESLVTGRPHGGLAILWRKSLSHCQVSTVKGESRIMELTVKLCDKTLYFVNVYMPYCSSDNLDEFQYYIHKCIDLVDASGHTYSMIIGDINADVSRDQNGHISHRFGRELTHVCANNNMLLVDVEYLGNSSDHFTYFSDSSDSCSWIDHAICTTSMAQLVSRVQIYYPCISSDHKPVMVELSNISEGTHPTFTSHTNTSSRSSIQWSDFTTKDYEKYKELTNLQLSKVRFNHDLLLCDDTHCNNPSHIAAINNFYNHILDALLASSEPFTKTFQTGYRQIPGWHEVLREHHQAARAAFLNWRQSGSPRQGPMYQQMKISRSQYKLAMRDCISDKEKHKSDSLASKFLLKTQNIFGTNLEKYVVHIKSPNQTA